MDIDSLLEGINFDNEEQQEQVKAVVDQELQKRLAHPLNTVDTLEKLVLTAFRQIMPFFYMILDFQSLEYFVDLKDSFDYIVDCQQKKVQRPFPKLEHYITLCDLISYAFDSSYLDGCPEEFHKKMKRFCTAFYKEIKQKDQRTREIAQNYNYPIFEYYFYFLQYYLNEDNEADDWLKRHCKDEISQILFEILWDMDDWFKHTVDESYFKQAMKNIFA